MKIQVCTWKTCKERFSKYIIDRLERDKDFYKWENIMIEECKCLWKCKDWPNIILDGTTETRIDPAKASKMVYNKKKGIKPKKKKKFNNSNNQETENETV